MRKAIKQIAVCALALVLFCVVCRLTVFRTYVAHIPIRGHAPGELQITMEPDPGRVRLGDVTWHGEYGSVPVHPDRPGNVDLVLTDQAGEDVAIHLLRVGALGTVYDWQTGGFTGDTGVLIAVTLFWLAVSAIMLWHYFQAKGPAYYAYSTIYFAGFSLFALAYDENDQYYGRRVNGEPYPIREDRKVVAAIQAQSEEDVRRILADETLWGVDLSSLTGRVYGWLTEIRKDPRAAVEELLG